MSSYETLIPLIHFPCNLKQESPGWESVKTQVGEALEEYGCFEATLDDHILLLHLRNSVFEKIQQLFDLPLHTKLLNTSHKPYHGYVGQNPQVPLYESLGIEDVLTPGKIDAFTNLLWPQGNPTFSKSIHCFAEQLQQVEIQLRRMILEILGLQKYMDEHIDSTDYILRFQKYDVPPINGNGTHELGLKPHTDKNFVTIVCQNLRGLQVEAKPGHWITAGTGSSPNSFIVTIGDAFHAWTNGRLKSTKHRVMISGDEVRYSIGFFAIPKSGYIIKAPQEMVDEDHPLLFKPFDNYKYLDFLYSDRMPTTSDQTSAALKAYCGA